jgi:aryl-alcohol dehydrogenase-like predicted oxidoreductase
MGAIEEKQAIRAIHAALDVGTSSIDTAEGYLTSEFMLGKALAGRRHGVVLATKLSGEHTPQHIRTAIENSLRLLRADYINLYQIHHPNPRWPIADTMAELLKLKDEGKTRYLGVSNFDVEQTAEATTQGPIVSSQPHYSMLFRSIEKDLLPYCLDQGIGVMAYAVLTRGLLSGKYQASHRFSDDDDRAHIPGLTPAVREAAVEICRRLTPWARDHGYTMAQLAIAWTVANPAVSSAICGAKTPAQAIENCEVGGGTWATRTWPRLASRLRAFRRESSSKLCPRGRSSLCTAHPVDSSASRSNPHQMPLFKFLE